MQFLRSNLCGCVVIEGISLFSSVLVCSLIRVLEAAFFGLALSA